MTKLLTALLVTAAGAIICFAVPPPFCMFSPKPPPIPTYPYQNDMAFWYQYEVTNEMTSGFARDSSPAQRHVGQPLTASRPTPAAGGICWTSNDPLADILAKGWKWKDDKESIK